MSTVVNPYKRMVLLPENEYTLLKQYRVPATTELYWPSAGSVEREQKLYALKLRAQREADDAESHDKVPTPTAKTSLISEVNHFPKTNQSRAKRLLAFLEEYRPNIQWNREGEVSFGAHGSPYSGSKISDLIYHATAVARRNFQPTAWPEFLTALRELNAPSTALSNATLKELEKGVAAPSKEVDTGDPLPPSHHPRKRKRRAPVVFTPKKWKAYH